MRRPDIPPPSFPPPDSPYWNERADAFLAIADPEMRILFVSDNCERIIGYAATELIGQVSIAFMHPDEVVENVNTHQELLGGGTREKVMRVQRKDGSYVDLSIQLIAVKESGSVKEIRAVCQAVTPKIRE